MIITISGPAGSGKSTLAGILAERLGCTLIKTGEIFRAMAAERGLSVMQFNLLAEDNASIDRELDRRVVESVKGSKDCIVEGRLSCHMLTRAGEHPFSVYLDAPSDIRAGRVAEREGRDMAAAAGENSRREESEKRRYMDIYGIDLDDVSCYTLTLDSTSSSPDELADAVLRRLRGDAHG